MKNAFVVGCLVFFSLLVTAQTETRNRILAAEQIKALKNGALVVRLKTNDKSIDAYRKAGQTELADKIAAENLAHNMKLVDAFRGFFDFCPVYFIYAKNTKALLNGTQGIFLDDALVPDANIKLKEKYFLIAEYGAITSNVRSDEYHYKGVYHTEASASASSTSVIFISDTTLTQLKEPFPFYQPTYLGNFNKAVEKLSRGLHKAYFNFDTSIQEERKRLKEELKKLK